MTVHKEKHMAGLPSFVIYLVYGCPATSAWGFSLLSHTACPPQSACSSLVASQHLKREMSTRVSANRFDIKPTSLPSLVFLFLFRLGAAATVRSRIAGISGRWPKTRCPAHFPMHQSGLLVYFPAWSNKWCLLSHVQNCIAGISYLWQVFMQISPHFLLSEQIPSSICKSRWIWCFFLKWKSNFWAKYHATNQRRYFYKFWVK